jgi:hypothetical protein
MKQKFKKILRLPKTNIVILIFINKEVNLIARVI